MRTLATLGLLALIASGAGGCATVKPWDRGDLARLERHNQRREDARAYEAHFWMVREASVGATGAPGGGCGCN